MALVPWGGSSATSFSEPVSSPFEPNGIIYANDVNVAIRVPSLVASAVWNTLGATNVDYQTSLTNAEDALSATVLACGMVYNSSLGAWRFPNKISFGDNATFDRGVEFSSAISVDGTTALSSTLTVDGATTLNSSLTVNGGAILTRSTPAQEALRINTGMSIFEDQTIDNVTYSSSYTASHSFLLTATYGSSLTPTYRTVIGAESISTGYLNFIAQSSQIAYHIDGFENGYFAIRLIENLEDYYLYCFTFSYTTNGVTYRSQAFYLKVYGDIRSFETIGGGVGVFRVVDLNHLYFYPNTTANLGNPRFKLVKICKIDN